MALLYQELTGKIIGAAMEVHRTLGCGFLEPFYQQALEIELELQGVPFVAQDELTITYKQRKLKQRYKPDFMVDQKVIVELKALDRLSSTEEAQAINYLKPPVTKSRCSSTLVQGHWSGSDWC